MKAIPHPAAVRGAEAPRLLNRMRRAIRVRHYSIRTEEAYLGWVNRFFRFHRRHPKDLDANEINRFLTHLAVHDRVAASTQRQALSAVLFLYREVLKLDPPWIDDIVRARQPKRLPVVLAKEEVTAIPCGIPSQPTCSWPPTTSAPSKNCSDTKMSRRQ